MRRALPGGTGQQGQRPGLPQQQDQPQNADGSQPGMYL
jgi:hypothetical protein